MSKEEAFNNVKQISKALDEQVRKDKQSHDYNRDYNLVDPKADKLAPGDNLISAIANSDILLAALNLDVHLDSGHIYYYGTPSFDIDSAIPVEELDDNVHVLIKQGCKFAIDKADYNTKLLDKIDQCRRKLNDVKAIA